MVKQYKVVVNMVKGEQAIDLAVQSGQALRVWVAAGANYLLQAADEQGQVSTLLVKARRAGKDLHLSLDGAAEAQVVLVGYYEVAAEVHTPLLGRMPDGTLREYTVGGALGADVNASGLSENTELLTLELENEAAPAAAALVPLPTGPGALVAALGGLAAATGGSSAGPGPGVPELTPEEALLQLQSAALHHAANGLSAELYQKAGVRGVGLDNVAAINDVLNHTEGKVPTQSDLQSIVSAYAKVLKAADRLDGNLVEAPTAQDYSNLAVMGVSEASAKMLDDVLDGKGHGDVDTVNKLQALADAAKAVIGYTASGGDAPSADQINSLLDGLSLSEQVSSDAQKAVQNKILANNTDSNGAIASQSELQDVVRQAMLDYKTSLDRIVLFAERQLPNPDGFPTLADYNNVGVDGVNPSNRLALNDALASVDVDGTAVSNPAKLQVVVDAYNTILAQANGHEPPDPVPAHHPTAAQYAAVGAHIGTASANAHDLALLNEAMGAQDDQGVDTVAKIDDLARITNAIQSVAAGSTLSPALTVQDLAKIGLDTTGLSNSSASQLVSLYKAIAAKADDGSETDTLSKLQAIIQDVLTGAAPTAVPGIGGNALQLEDLLGSVPHLQNEVLLPTALGQNEHIDWLLQQSWMQQAH